jgi:hypothetical protein
MNFYSGGFFKIVTFIFIALSITLTLPRFSPVVFPQLALPSPSFDCDDATLAMYLHFQSLGIASIPLVGNLNIKGEEYEESNHVWLLVKSGDKEIAYDWGMPRFDRQHYEGYTISIDYLLSAVAEDFEDNDALAISER